MCLWFNFPLYFQTAVTAACLHGRKEAAHFLLEVGADVSLPNNKSFPPLLCAAKSGRWEIADALITVGAELEAPDKFGRTSAMIAAGEGHSGVLNLLLDKGQCLCAIGYIFSFHLLVFLDFSMGAYQ